MPQSPTVIIASRGSALALAQAGQILQRCQQTFPDLSFEIKIFKTTGDKLQTASLAQTNLPKGLFTKELETALLQGDADLAVHSLKDLPTELPAGLCLGAVPERVDARDVLVCHQQSLPPRFRLADLPPNITVGTSSTRRAAQIREQRPDLRITTIRGNVGTRLEKLASQEILQATILAAAGLARLGYHVSDQGRLVGPDVPPDLQAAVLDFDEMLPCVGQAALGLEIMEDNERLRRICQRLNDPVALACVLAERAFLQAMGGGCQLAVAAYCHALPDHSQLDMTAVSFLGDHPRRARAQAALSEAAALGHTVARQLAPGS